MALTSDLVRKWSFLDREEMERMFKKKDDIIYFLNFCCKRPNKMFIFYFLGTKKGADSIQSSPFKDKFSISKQ